MKDINKKDKYNVVNQPVKKIDSLALSCGKPKYVGDFIMPNMAYVKILTSPYANAKITELDDSEALNMKGVLAVFSYKNVDRVPHTTAGQGYPEPSPYDTYSFDNRVRHVGDRVAAIVADSVEIAEEAMKKIKVKYIELDAVLDPRDAMKKDAPVIHDEEDAHVIIPIEYDPAKNMAAHVSFKHGDLEKAFENSDHVFENTYSSHYAQHTPIEPHISMAYTDEYGRIVIVTSTQVPFHVRRITAQALKIPVSKIRVIKPRIGGGFGTKQEVLLEDVVALATMKTKRPCLLELTRKEEFVSSRTRHPQIVTIKSGINNDGTLTAMKMDVLSNTGAYGSHALTVVCNCGSKVLPLYRTDNVSFDGTTVYTNLPVCGAYRGYGATQAAFAVECQMDIMAEAIGMDAIELRKKNHIKVGEGSPVFEALGEGKEGVPTTIGSCGLEECINIGMKDIQWNEKRGKSKEQKGVKKTGVGMCALMQGSSVPEIDMGSASIKMNEDGGFNLNIGATDIGTGSDTILAQIAAEVLETSIDKFVVYSSDTDMTPFDVGAYASSTTYLSGYAVKKAALKIKEQIVNTAFDIISEKNSDVKKEELECEESKVLYRKDGKVIEEVTYSEVCIYALYQKDQYQIAATESHITHKSPPPFSAHFAEVEVDEETGELKLLKYIAAVDCGTAINPVLADGQTQGAVMNGLSFALTEEYIFNNKGVMLNPNFKHYKIFSTGDMPEIKTYLVPTHEPTGPFGAKSVSEISINGALPAIANAIYDAVGVRILEAPFTAEKIFNALKEKK